MKLRAVTLMISLVISQLGYTQVVKEGMWRGSILYDNIEVPFNFRWKSTSQSTAEVTILNGEEQIEINNARISGDSLFVPLGVFDSELRIKYANNRMTGEWHKNYRASNGPAFYATYNQPRFKDSKLVAIPKMDYKWKISFKQPNGAETTAICLIEQHQHKITGSILTEIGDYRYFEGVLGKDSIWMSSFDGVHAFLLKGRYSNKSIKGTLYFEPGYAEHFTAVPDADITLPNPFNILTVEPKIHKPYYDILTAGGEYNAIDTDSLEGKVVVIQLMGTWCPNSFDQTNYLVEWSKTKPTEVEIIAVTYEPGDKTYAQKRIDSYKRQMNVPYPIYVGGRLSKGQAALAFPNMERINAFPTLVIIDKKGYIRYINSYFNGPATGEYYQAFDKEFNQKIGDLLAE